MKPSTRRISDPGRKQTLLALAIIAASLGVVGGFGWYASQGQHPPTGSDGCKVGQMVPDAHTIVLIDQTDRLSGEQLLYVRALILREYMRLGLTERFSVVGLEAARTSSYDGKPDGVSQEDTARKLPDFSRCRIQAGSEADWTTQNSEQIARRFKRLVGSQLAQTIEGLANTPPAPTSPILETIDRLSKSIAFASPQIRRRLVIVSDLAQHVPGGVTHYPPPGARFAYAGDAPLSEGDLSGMQVRIHYVTRDDLRAIQNPDHRSYWSDYFSKSGATDISIGWGLSPDPLNDTLSPPKDPARPGSRASLFKSDPGQIIAEPVPAQTVDAGAPAISTAPPKPDRAVAEPHYSVERFEPSTPIRLTGDGASMSKWPLSNAGTPVLHRAGRNELLSVVGLARQPDGLWYQVILQDGRKAFVPSVLISAPIPPASRVVSDRTALNGGVDRIACILPNGTEPLLGLQACRQAGGVRYPARTRSVANDR
jgi:hypothetical protein